ncbi:PPE family protein [Mycobacterium malmoense]|uniref:PPE domain-containing protein n=1 Tax=Mycobacterium malmoense TaxID=1780 RepID=A0ABX3SMY6_MYCMA|nr:PPE family protein [Mycobacterium malmoense]OIN78126.1 hypothetical protein BMG05_24830 [Mycobacterium malmoense]ORA79606.1 hypothetical protein BST29_18665 [Mycobacterium malmoense]QZA18612.1 PPE family protein [Mycobacterium malmoense]UNB95384.1 PPE family protein [Mycobacterium malmoense]
MDFGMLPPEIIAALVHSGPGAGSLIEASGVWRLLSTELEESVSGYASALGSLTGAWRGPSAAEMIQAVEPYLAWLRTTAQQCRQVGSSMQAAAAAFDLAVRTVVPPLGVIANRTRLAQLLATNWFGSNLAAIAETEAQYAGMWVNNSAAMYHYRAASAQALALPQFSSPPAIVNPAAAAVQASAVPAATGSSTTSTLASNVAALLDPGSGALVNNSWFQLANTWGNQFIAGGIPINLLSYLAQMTSAQALQSVGGDVDEGLAEGEAALSASEADFASALRALGSAQAPTAAMGVGVSLGKLTAPAAVVGLLPASQSPVQLASAVSPLPVGEFGLPSIPMPPMTMPPSASAASASKRRREGRDYENIEYGLELKGTVMQRPPSAG